MFCCCYFDFVVVVMMEKLSSSKSFFASSIGCYSFTMSLMLMMILMLLSLVNASVVCPPPAAYAPYCYCSEWSHKPGTINLDCARNAAINDTQMSDILDAFITTPGVSPVGYLFLVENQLTRVTSQINFFPQLETVDLQNNAITSADSGTFNFQDAANPIKDLLFAWNGVKTIAPGAFQGQRQELVCIVKFVHKQ